MFLFTYIYVTTFDSIVKDEEFTQEVLICTSVLDNGINIKDENIHNIALFNVYERTEFIQMIGRLRIDDSAENSEINLHVTLPTIDSLKEQMRRDTQNLIFRLSIDNMTIPERKNFYTFMSTTDIPHDKHMFRFPDPDNDNVFCEYNPCAIYQLVDSLSCMMRIIRKNEPEYCIEPKSIDSVADQAALVKSYIDATVDEKDWSRSVIDLLGLKEEIERRKELYEEDKKEYDFWENYYQYNFDDTFLNYLLGTLIPNSLANAWQEGFEKCISSLDAKTQNYIHTLQKKAGERESLSFVKRIKIVCNDSIYESLHNDCQKALDFYGREASKVDKGIKHYNQLLENTGIPIVEHLKWIERNIDWDEDYTKKQDDDKKDYEFIRGTCCAIVLKESKTYEEFIVRIAVTPDMLEQAKGSGKSYNKQFLLQYGVPIDTQKPTPEETEISQKFLNGVKFQGKSGELGKEHAINGETYLVTSCKDNTNEHSIYYVYVKQLSPTKVN